jgi:glycosyltransferase involved in cell wall biosynthesis
MTRKIIRFNKNISVIPDGTPQNIFKPIKKNIARNKLKWNPKSNYILFHRGSRPKHKNFNLAVEVFQLIKETLVNSEFIVFDDELSQADLALYFSGANLLLFTSSSEGSPNIVREAIACGCPVVALNVGDVKYWIELSESGGVVNSDIESLANKSIETILSKNRAKFEISDLYSTQNSAKLISNLYSKLAQKVGFE